MRAQCLPKRPGKLTWSIRPIRRIWAPMETVAQLWDLVCVGAVTAALRAKPCAISGQAARPEASRRSRAARTDRVSGHGGTPGWLLRAVDCPAVVGGAVDIAAGQAIAGTAARWRALMALSRLWLAAHRCSSRSVLPPR